MDSFVEKAITLLNSGRISDSIIFIRRRLESDRNAAALDKLDRLRSTYGYMLDYMIQGAQDPGRRKLYSDIREQLYSIVRGIEEDVKAKESGTLYYTSLRNIRFSGTTLRDALARYVEAGSASLLLDEESEDFQKVVTEKDRSLKDIFSIVWTLPIGDTDTLRSVIEAALTSDLDFRVRALLVSALTLNLLTVYDRLKLLALLEIETKTDSERLKARAIVGMLLVMNRYANRLRSDYELDLRFQAWTDDDGNFSRVREATFALVKARGARNLLNEMEKDILPDLMKLGPQLMEDFKKLKDDQGKISLESIEENPKWEKMMNDKKFEKKLRRFARIQQDGGDFSLAMFSQLSGNFFFNDIDVWFRPFCDDDIVAMGIAPMMRPAFSIIHKLTSLCDTDKFAMALNLRRLPPAARNIMASTADAQQEEMKEEMKEAMLYSSQPEYDVEVYNYARMLYRFFNYFRLKREFSNPLDEALDITRIPHLQKFLNNEEILESVSEYYMRQKFYADAISSYGILAEKDPLSRHLYDQKRGYCYEKSGDSLNAFDCYMRAAQIDSDDEWLAKKIYSTGLESGNYKEAADALVSLLEANPENLKFILDLIDILLKHPEVVCNDKYSVGNLISKAEFLIQDSGSVDQTITGRIARSRVNYFIISADYKSALDAIEPIVSDISMYLAAKALGAPANNNTDDSPEDEKLMADDLVIYITLLGFMHDEKGIISAISQLLMLDKVGLSPLKVLVKLRDRWKSESGLEEIREFLPLYVDAAVRANS